ncbi:MAG: hypothetical protein WBV61_01025 [Rhodanobacteraceae bacterium]
MDKEEPGLPGLPELIEMIKSDEQFYREVWLLSEDESERELHQRKALSASAILAEIRAWQDQHPAHAGGEGAVEHRRAFEQMFDRAFRALIRNRTLGLTRRFKERRNQPDESPLRKAG